jgi:TIR domain
MAHHVFISYASKDKEIAGTVCEALEKDGIPCWIAPRDIPPGVEYADAIIEALNTCHVFLIILSEASNTSPQVRREVERAVSKDLNILTFRIDNTIPSKAMEYYLSNRHWLDAADAVLSKQLKNLSEAVRKLLNQPPADEEERETPKPILTTEPEVPVPTTEAEPRIGVPVPKPPEPVKQRRLGWLWALIIVFALAAAVLLYMGWRTKNGLPALDWFVPTNTIHPTKTPNRTATAEKRIVAQTAEARSTWIDGFAEPILSEIASRSPDWQDDFSNSGISFSKWSFFQNVTIENGKGVIAAITDWNGAGGVIYTENFVVKYTITYKRQSSQQVMVGFSFREAPDASTYNHFTLTTEDGWCGFGEGGSATNNEIFSEWHWSSYGLDQTIQVTIIVEGDQAAAYINDQPMTFTDRLLPGGNTFAIGGSVSEGTTTILIDDFQVWNR